VNGRAEHVPPQQDNFNNDFNIDFLQALKILKEDERTAMLLFYMEDQTVEKISKIMNCPTNTIKSHLHRGQEKIAIYFK
jgi:RNA polymerase sigma-70 factor (ECF subfamily)